MNIPLAIEFVKTHGSAIEQARLNVLLNAQRPTPQDIASLFKGQRADGGWRPLWAVDYSSIDATCFRLAQAEQLAIDDHHPALIKAIEFLSLRQHSDSTWEEEETVAELAPPWAVAVALPRRKDLA
jgi:hypothetical protein